MNAKKLLSKVGRKPDFEIFEGSYALISEGRLRPLAPVRRQQLN